MGLENEQGSIESDGCDPSARPESAVVLEAFLRLRRFFLLEDFLNLPPTQPSGLDTQAPMSAKKNEEEDDKNHVPENNIGNIPDRARGRAAPLNRETTTLSYFCCRGRNF